MLAMKVAAFRTSDHPDIGWVAEHLGLTDPDEIIELTERVLREPLNEDKRLRVRTMFQVSTSSCVRRNEDSTTSSRERTTCRAGGCRAGEKTACTEKPSSSATRRGASFPWSPLARPSESRSKPPSISDRMHSPAPDRPLAVVTPQRHHVHTLHGAPVQTHTGRDLLAERPPTH